MSHVLLKGFVSRVRRRMDMRITRFCRSICPVRGQIAEAATSVFDHLLSNVTTFKVDSREKDANVARTSGPVSWLKAAMREFESFPEPVRAVCLSVLTIAEEGAHADIAKPLKSFGSDVLEIALPYRGIKTSQPDLRLIRERLKRLKEQLYEESKSGSSARQR